MRKLARIFAAILILLLTTSLICFAQDVNDTESVYIPKNLKECFVELEKVLIQEKLLEEFKSVNEEEIGHCSLFTHALDSLQVATGM